MSLGLNLSSKKTRKRKFREEMDKVVPWTVPVQIVEPYYPRPNRPAAISQSRILRVVDDLLSHKGLLKRSGTAADAMLTSAPSSPKNA